MTYKHIPVVITGVFTAMLLILYAFRVRASVKQKQHEVNFQKQLKYSINPQMDEEKQETRLSKALIKLPKLMIKAEIVDPGTNPERLKSQMLTVAGFLLTGGIIISGNPLMGLIPIVAGYVGLHIYSSIRIKAIKQLIEEQLPGFVATFKANIQANQHPQNAMANAIDNTAVPLFNELERAKAIMEVGDFKPGIIYLRHNTDNDTLRQIASCIELAAESGANIEKQIETIEGIIEDKQAIERKKRLGINENKPLFIIASLFVPISFIGSYFISDMHRDFWFKTALSWILLLILTIVMSISIFATWKVIQAVED